MAPRKPARRERGDGYTYQNILYSSPLSRPISSYPPSGGPPPQGASGGRSPEKLAASPFLIPDEPYLDQTLGARRVMTLLLWIAIHTSTIVVPGYESGTTVISTTPHLYVFAQPLTPQPFLQEADALEAYEVISRQGDWIQLQDRFGRIIGWVDSSNVRTIGDALSYFDKEILTHKTTFNLLSRAKCHIIQNHLPFAGRDIEEALAISPADLQAYRLRAEMREAGNDLMGALSDIKSATKQQAHLTGNLVSRGLIRRKIGDFDGSLSDFCEAISLSPKDPVPYVLRGELSCHLGRHRDAIMDYTTAIRLDPSFMEPYASRGVCRSELRAFNHAIEDFDVVIRQNYQLKSYLVHRGYCFSSMQVYNKAISDYSYAIQLGDQSSFTYLSRGIAYYEVKDFEKANADLLLAARRGPLEADAYLWLARCADERKMYKTSIHYYDTCITLNQYSVDACAECAWLLSSCPEKDLRDGKKAIGLAQQACEFSAWKSPSCAIILAAAYAEQEDFESAIVWQENALSLLRLHSVNDTGLQVRDVEAGLRYYESRVKALAQTDSRNYIDHTNLQDAVESMCESILRKIGFEPRLFSLFFRLRRRNGDAAS